MTQQQVLQLRQSSNILRNISPKLIVAQITNLDLSTRFGEDVLLTELPGLRSCRSRSELFVQNR